MSRSGAYGAREAGMMADAAFYRKNGYVIVEDLIDRALIDRILAEGTAVCRGERGPVDDIYQYASAETRIAYHPRNVPVSNYSDFYSWKGKVDTTRAFLRRPGAMPEDTVLSVMREQEKAHAG
jgi:hypothetical protein